MSMEARLCARSSSSYLLRIAPFPHRTFAVIAGWRMPEQSPAFQFYPKDFLADSNVALMGNDETGIYIRLICYCWLDGSLPSSLDEIARMLPRTSAKALQRVWPIISRCFEARSDGRLIHKRIEAERSKQERRRRERSASGAAGAKAKWDGNLMALPLGGDGSAIKTPLAPDGSPSPSPSPTSSAIASEGSGSRFRPGVVTVVFADADEQLVTRLIANVAAKNKTGEISNSRVLNLRAQLHDALKKFGHDAWRHGCEISAGKGLGVDYAIGVMRNYRPGEGAHSARSAAPSFSGERSADEVEAAILGRTHV